MAEASRDIENIEDIQALVDLFYGKIREDDMLKDIFNNIIQDRWPQHLNKMYRFWQTVLLDDHTYYGSPFVPHAYLPVDAEHFERWIGLFNEAVDSLFEGRRAERAKWQGQRMAEMFLMKIRMIRERDVIPLK
ncbi:MAG: group III truncated hemoglobin [Chitinophagales bacterium]|nr:group III truncated hemoglobin [Chitinophagales bacterium]